MEIITHEVWLILSNYNFYDNFDVNVHFSLSIQTDIFKKKEKEKKKFLSKWLKTFFQYKYLYCKES